MVLGGGKRYATNVCMYAALFRLYSSIITRIACRRVRRRCHRESVPYGPQLVGPPPSEGPGIEPRSLGSGVIHIHGAGQSRAYSRRSSKPCLARAYLC